MITHFKIPLLLCLLFTLNTSAQTKDLPEQLDEYLNHHDFFRLRTYFSLNQSKLSPKQQLYFKAFIDNSFNQCKRSADEIRLLLATYKNQLNSKDIIALQTLQMDNYVKTYRYKAAAITGSQLIEKYSSDLDTAKLSDLKNTNILWKSLSNVAPQEVVRNSGASINWDRDIAGLMNIPVIVNGHHSEFIFDTGANISTISESFAKQFHLQLIKTSFDLGSGTSVKNKATLAVAKDLKIGAIELKNIVFIVLPDDQLSFPQIKYTIHGIIGFPVISQLGEIHIKTSGTLIIPAKGKHIAAPNLALDELFPIISLRTESDTLSYCFDTGAKQTELFKLYFDKYKSEITQNGKLDSVKRGGAGGVVKYQVYKLPEFSFCVASKKVMLPDVHVLTSSDGGKDDFYYGNIGQDLIHRFNEMIIDFKRMYVDFK